ncbi:phenylalanyl-tRNA synthetase subunit beta [Candidatus Uzinura diaspidicola str. ASNER]|uniref:Phenylalanine--tRNA ligase beta subunit n=1 Tax=Candidatus Uzinura diaspidicola str. ASNER TaxID=1133592 RepID=L7VN42_9FLAO|nr:phenylalanyl-tRNA synthetase subunit beta [Candidatus Uzinura diaspidicola str. ASNER]
MKISYDWLIQYLDSEISHKDICEILTESGLEVESCQEINNLIIERVVLGEILDFQAHPYSVNFNILQVDIGKDHILQIICGDTNISKGKKVIIAPIGADIFLDNTGKKKQLEIINIHGIFSYGFICSYKNIGLQDNNILYIYNGKLPGTPAKDFFKIRKDYCIEIEITPNRVDTMSHWGIARELYAILKRRRYAALLHKPSVENFQSKNLKNFLISINETDKCKRYSGCIISGVKIATSPIWIQHRLRSIGLHPNNNVIDIINFVMHEFGHPLNVFDVEDIDGKEIHIKTLQENNRNAKLILKNKDLIICDAKKTIGLAGIFESKIKGTTKDIFVESAYFEPVNIRKSIKKHDINTYSSFLFQRGVDPEQIVYVLKRAAALIKEIAGGEIYATTDIYPRHIPHFKTILRYKQIHFLLGKEISKQSIKKILFLLEIDILIENKHSLNVSVPSYRVDVYREIDLIEDILRIYGYNHIKIPKTFYYSTNIEKKNTFQYFENNTSTLLNAQGFYEVVNLSLTKYEYSKFLEPTALSTIKLLNPLSKEIEVLRESLLFGLLERISYNIKRKNLKLKFFEWGKTYEKIEKKYNEKYYLGLMISGKEHKDHWLYTTGIFSFFYLKGVIEGILTKYGIRNIQQKIKEDILLEHALWLYHKDDTILRMGRIKNKVIEYFDIKQDVFYAEIYCTIVFKIIQDYSIRFEPISQLPGARRDLAILLDKRISFEELYQKIKSTREEIIKDIQLFDVYESNNLQRETKSYALSFYLEDKNKNLTEAEIVKTIENLQKTLSKSLGINLRK